MSVLNRLKQSIYSHLFPLRETDAEKAYDLWSENYDLQPDNLMLALDEAVFSELIARVDFRSKIIVDIGCGTGRHWEKMYAKNPSEIIGYDVSEGMLKVLKKKFPKAQTYQLETNRLSELANNSCDFIISTLAIAHINDIENALAEWARVLKEDGHLIITDYHPDALASGGNRTFKHDGKLIAIKNHVYPMARLFDIANKLGFKVEEFIEEKIDETVKSYYERQQALEVFERFKGSPIIYGARLIRVNAAK